MALVSERCERDRGGVESPQAARIPAALALSELVAHLSGPEHGLDPALFVPSTSDEITGGSDPGIVRRPPLDGWLHSLHLTHHGCPYPPAVPHPL